MRSHPTGIDDGRLDPYRTWSLQTALRTNGDGTRELLIERTEPQIKISAELLEMIAEGHSPWARLTWPDGSGPDPVFGLHVGAILRIDASNQTVIYRVEAYHFQPDYYVAEFPD